LDEISKTSKGDINGDIGWKESRYNAFEERDPCPWPFIWCSSTGGVMIGKRLGLGQTTSCERLTTTVAKRSLSIHLKWTVKENWPTPSRNCSMDANAGLEMLGWGRSQCLNMWVPSAVRRHHRLSASTTAMRAWRSNAKMGDMVEGWVEDWWRDSEAGRKQVQHSVYHI